MRLEEGQDTIIEHIGGDQSVLAVVELGRGDLGIRVDEGLLVDASNALEGADIERILGAQVRSVTPVTSPLLSSKCQIKS